MCVTLKFTRADGSGSSHGSEQQPWQNTWLFQVASCIHMKNSIWLFKAGRSVLARNHWAHVSNLSTEWPKIHLFPVPEFSAVIYDWTDSAPLAWYQLLALKSKWKDTTNFAIDNGIRSLVSFHISTKRNWQFEFPSNCPSQLRTRFKPNARASEKHDSISARCFDRLN